jgi:hypothetical protein
MPTNLSIKAWPGLLSVKKGVFMPKGLCFVVNPCYNVGSEGQRLEVFWHGAVMLFDRRRPLGFKVRFLT